MCTPSLPTRLTALPPSLFRLRTHDQPLWGVTQTHCLKCYWCTYMYDHQNMYPSILPPTARQKSWELPTLSWNELGPVSVWTHDVFCSMPACTSMTSQCECTCIVACTLHVSVSWWWCARLWGNYIEVYPFRNWDLSSARFDFCCRFSRMRCFLETAFSWPHPPIATHSLHIPRGKCARNCAVQFRLHNSMMCPLFRVYHPTQLDTCTLKKEYVHRWKLLQS